MLFQELKQKYKGISLKAKKSRSLTQFISTYRHSFDGVAKVSDYKMPRTIIAYNTSQSLDMDYKVNDYIIHHFCHKKDILLWT